MTTDPGRVALVYPRPTFDSVPSLCNAAELLAREGFAVDVLATTEPGTPPPEFADPAISFRSIGSAAPSRPSYLARARGRAARLLGSPAPATDPPVAALPAAVVEELHRRHADRPYRLVIGVDPDGLILAGQLASALEAPLGYYSLELLLDAELTGERERRLKERERELCRRVELAIVQDADRAALLADGTGLPLDRIALVPNSPLGPARRRPNDDLRHRFGLRSDKRIVLHAGSLGDWTGIEEIVASVPGWPAEWVLVVHTRYDAGSSAYVDKLRARAAADRVFFSLRPLPRQAYDALVDGADVGIAFYVPADGSAFTQENLRTIGLSSGKLAYYARAGLPVIVNDATSLGGLVADAGCGIAVESAAELGDALARVGAAYDAYSDRARQLFDERLDAAHAFEDVVRRLTQPVATS